MKILIDTCAFLWIVEESPKLSQRALTAFMDLENERFLSAASVWEIAIKYAAGRLKLSGKPEILIPGIRHSSGIQSLEIDEESALLAGRLSRFHTDPIDRLLVAQAIVHDMVILTPDPHIEQYAVRVLW